MPAPIPPGYRELNANEIILSTDLICPRGETKFKLFKKKSSAPGSPYKHKETPLFPEAIVVRKVEITNIFCERIDRIPGGAQFIYDLCKKHPIYQNYKYDSMTQNSLYILTNWCGMIGSNHIGTDKNTNFGSYKVRGVNNISHLELMKLLGAELPKQKPMMIRLVMDVLLRPI